MDFKIKEQNNNITGRAWDNLRQRLDSEGLLRGNDERQRLRQKTGYIRLYVAAVFVACIISGWYFMQKTDLDNHEMMVLYNEANAPTLATILEDGSVVYLSGQTSLKYPDHFDNDKREVSLRGDAFFDIKKQSNRPFFIDTELAKIEVTGTSFGIKGNDESSFLLSVLEGSVLVTRKSDQQSLSIKAGETVLFDFELLRLINSAIQFDDYFKHIHFKDEYLKNVAHIINMHSDSIVLKIDHEVEMRSITFPFSTDSDIAGIAKVICQAMELQHSRQENTIYISK